MEAGEEVESGTLEAGGRPEASRPDSLVRENSTLPPGVYLVKHRYIFFRVDSGGGGVVFG